MSGGYFSCWCPPPYCQVYGARTLYMMRIKQHGIAGGTQQTSKTKTVVGIRRIYHLIYPEVLRSILETKMRAERRAGNNWKRRAAGDRR